MNKENNIYISINQPASLSKYLVSLSGLAEHCMACLKLYTVISQQVALSYRILAL
jgi:hypothetical protein